MSENKMADADERAESQANGADKDAGGFVRRLAWVDVRESGGGAFETRRLELVEGVTPRALVMLFAQHMETVLRRNEQPPRNKEPWDRLRYMEAVNLARVELDEVTQAWGYRNDELMFYEPVDVANYMMIAMDLVRDGGPSRDRGVTLTNQNVVPPMMEDRHALDG